VVQNCIKKEMFTVPVMFALFCPSPVYYNRNDISIKL
jgi:hypothetical protein